MTRKIFAFFFIICLLPEFSLAGGLDIIKDTITLNGKSNDFIVSTNEHVSIRYIARDYSYSGRRGEIGFHVLVWTPTTGAGASSKRSIQDRISYKNGGSSSFVVPARFYAHSEGHYSSMGETDLGYSGEFTAPSKPGDYDLCYSRATLFLSDVSPRHLGRFSERELTSHLKRHGIECAAKFHVTEESGDFGQDISIYMNVNDRLPYDAPINPGVSENPVKFSWHIKGDIPSEALEYQYRLYPDENWSDPSKSTEVEYYYFSEGQHEFQVRGFYTDRFGRKRETQMAKLSFPLRQAFVAQPTKASGGRSASPIAPIFHPPEMYSRSRAIIVGITKFSDSHFSPLPFVENDVRLIDEGLRNQGFTTDIVEGAHTKADVNKKLGEFFDSLRPNDRVIIYFSTHGFQHPVLKNRAYLATTDCSIEHPDDTCISLASLEDRLSIPLALPVKHALVILDACAAGLGVLAKGATFNEGRLIAEKGAHMITAGMADELAQGDIDKGSSYFTGFFVDGLNGAADYTKDGIVTLTELLLFTRYNVSRSTNGSQTPMLGRILGPGEMVFEVKNLSSTQ